MELFEELLKHYQLTKEDYARITREPSFSNIPTIESHELTKKAIDRINKAIRSGEKIIIYGDYDCDGVMSTSIMVKALRRLGGRVASYLPSRYLDGYGINLENAQKIASNGYNLVITVDNGVSAHEALNFLKERQIDVIVIDHHEITSTLPPASSVIHPTTLGYGEYPVSAGYLSFIFSCALLGEIDPYLLTLGALSTLSDMMPLKGHNREIVRLALLEIEKHRFPAISEFVAKQHIDEKTLSMELIPAINAIGRVVEDSTINRLVSYFADDDPMKMLKIGQWMKEVNDSRKALTKQASEGLDIDENLPGVIVTSSLPEGLNGLLANRLMETYGKPTIVFSPSKKNPDILVGSMRSKDGFSVIDALSFLGCFLVAGGGHEFAGGLSIKAVDFEAFKKDFFFLCLKNKMSVQESDTILLNINQCNQNTFDLIKSFSPFGKDWKEPTFRMNNVAVKDLTFTRDGRFLSTKLEGGARLFSFRLGADYFADKNLVDLKVSFGQSEFKGRLSLDIYCDKF